MPFSFTSRSCFTKRLESLFFISLYLTSILPLIESKTSLISCRDISCPKSKAASFNDSIISWDWKIIFLCSKPLNHLLNYITRPVFKPLFIWTLFIFYFLKSVSRTNWKVGPACTIMLPQFSAVADFVCTPLLWIRFLFGPWCYVRSVVRAA